MACRSAQDLFAVAVCDITLSVITDMCLQRRCYWLLDSKDDIVLVHYLNTAQSQQGGRRMLTEDNGPPFNSERDSQPHPFRLSDPTRSSDSEPALRICESSQAAQTPHSSTSYPNSFAVASSGTGDSARLSPSVSSMEMPYSVTDSKHNLGAKLSRVDALHSNAAVQELLYSWENENQSIDLPLLQYAHDDWQVGHYAWQQQSTACNGCCTSSEQLCITLHNCNLTCTIGRSAMPTHAARSHHWLEVSC